MELLVRTGLSGATSADAMLEILTVARPALSDSTIGKVLVEV
jgi:hypothetical protein